MEQAQVELIVRATARVSAACFAAALIAFAARAPRHHEAGSTGVRLFVAFILAHTIHFGAVLWLAVLTSGENIRARDGWFVVLTVGALFYLAAFAILGAWRGFGAGRTVTRAKRLAGHAGVAFIAVIFLNSYAARVGRMPVYWVPAILMVAVVTGYFIRVGGDRVQDTRVAPPM